jgi:hypothetical protein
MIKKYKEIPYIIYRNAEVSTYAAYIRIPEDHPYFKIVRKKQSSRFSDKYDIDYEAVPLDVHSGLTFGQHVTKRRKWPQGFTPGYWVGWDYAHAGDVFPGRGINFPDDHEWTAEEVEKECMEAIEQLIDAYELRD